MYRSSLLVFGAALWIAVLAPPVVAEPQFDFQDTTLANGLRVITMEDFSCPIVTVQVWYGVGSKDENPSRQGFAHMFEHMMFRGTGNLGPEAYFKLINSVGGTLNGTTNFDRTKYYQTVPSNQLDLALWLEAERMLFLKITEDGFATERGVVEEERRMGLNAPYGTLIEQLMPVVFKEHPYRWSPIGRIPHLRAAGIEELRHWWDTYYVPANATLIVVGAVSHEHAMRAVDKYFGWMPKLATPPKVTVREPEQTSEREFDMKERLGPVPVVAYVYRTVPQNHPDTLPLQILFDVLVGGESSRTHLDIVKERKLGVQMIPIVQPLQMEGIHGLGVAMSPFGKSDMEPVLAALDQHIDAIKTDGVTERELEKAKNGMLRNVVTAQLTVQNKAQAIGNTTIMYGGPDWLNEQLEAIGAVTVEDIVRVAREYFVTERRTVLRVTPDKDYVYDPNAGWDPKDYSPPERVLAKTSIERPRSWPSRPPLGEVKGGLPEIPSQEKTLKNGLKVVVVPNDEVPFATAMLGLKYGAWTDAAGAPGVASMTLSMLTKGTEKHTAKELAQAIEFEALTLGGAAGRDVSTVSATGLSDKLATALELMAEVVLTPTFPKTELDILKRQLKSSLAIQSKDPKYQADRELRRRVYGDHPYSRTPTGEVEDIDPIERKQLEDWWSTYARPDQAVLYLAGDVSAVDAFAMAERYFADWKPSRKKPPKVKIAALPDRQKTHIHLIHEPNAVQSEIRVAQLSINRDHPDYYKSLVFNQVFGGSFGSRLNKKIRVDLGLTYGARGSISPMRFTGLFSANTFTKTESTSETLVAVLDVIKSMQETAPSAEEIEIAKSYLVGKRPADFETPQAMVAHLWNMEYNGLPEDHLQRVMSGIEGAESGDIHRISQSHIDMDNLTIVVLGDAEKIKAGLEEIGVVTQTN